MDIFNLISYKLESFLNIRPAHQALGVIFYQEDEPLLLSAAAKKSNGTTLYVSRWHDLFSASAFEKAMLKQGFTEADCYALLLVLSRFGHLLDIDNRQRTNKDYFIFFYLIQLISLKNSPIDEDAAFRNHMLTFLLFELSIDDEVYHRFSIKDNQLLMVTEAFGFIALLHLINVVYKTIKADTRKEHALLSTLKAFQTNIVKLLVTPDNKNYRLNFNDRYSELMYPDVFLYAYTHHRQQVFEALVDTVDPLQSTENLFVSSIILMNYAFYILRTHPREILKLKKFVDDDALFGKLLEAVIKRRMGVTKVQFEKIPTGHDLSLINDKQTSFYNILYSL